MSLEQTQELMNKVISFAKDSGADADVIFSRGESFSLKSQSRKLSEYKVANSQALGVRTIKNGKVGVSYTESLDNEALKEMVKQAIESSVYTKDNPDQLIDSSTSGETHIKDAEANVEDKTSAEEKIEIALALEAKALDADKRAKSSPYNGISSSSGEKYYLNSYGRFCSKQSRSHQAIASVLLDDGSNQAMFYDWDQKRSFVDLDIDNIVNRTVTYASDLMDASAIATGKYDVIFEIDQLKSIFGCFSGTYGAKGVILKTNPWRDKLNEIVMDERLSLFDLPQYEKAFSKSYFDMEGNLKSDLTLVENGKLQSFLHNSETAKTLGMQNNFRAARGTKSPLGIGGSTKLFKTSDANEADLQTGRYILVTGMDGLHSGANASSGNFSFGLSAYLFEDGQKVQTVKGVTLSGNFYEMLNNVTAIGSELQSTREGNFFSPALRFSGLDIAGK